MGLYYTDSRNYDMLAAEIVEDVKFNIKCGHCTKNHRFFTRRPYYYTTIELRPIRWVPISPNPKGYEKRSFEYDSKELVSAVKKQPGVIHAGVFYSASNRGYVISIEFSADAV